MEVKTVANCWDNNKKRPVDKNEKKKTGSITKLVKDIVRQCEDTSDCVLPYFET